MSKIDSVELQRVHDEFFAKARYKKVDYSCHPMAWPDDTIKYLELTFHQGDAETELMTAVQKELNDSKMFLADPKMEALYETEAQYLKEVDLEFPGFKS